MINLSGKLPLEVDLARLLPGPFQQAAKDLLGTRAAADQQTCLDKIGEGEDDADVRKEFLRRIEDISKGRFAQRLAEHLAAADLTGLRDVLDPGHRTGYLLQALNRASRLVRGRPLLDDRGVDEAGDHAEPTP